MRRILTFSLLMVLVVFSFTPVADQAECTVESLFTTPYDEEASGKIELRIREEIENAKETIDIAMFSFTDNELGEVVKDVSDDVEVRVILEGQREDEKGGVCQSLKEARIHVRFDDYKDSLFHHKFVVIDSKKVITGSYNWSDNADKDNFENVVIIECSKIASDYLKEFNRLWSNSKDKVDPSIYKNCIRKLNSTTVEKFREVSGIGEKLALDLEGTKPFKYCPCHTISNLREQLENVDGIGSKKSRDILKFLCPYLFGQD